MLSVNAKNDIGQLQSHILALAELDCSV